MNSQAEAAVRALKLLDLTSLGEHDTEASVTALCQRAVTPLGHVAAVCIWPRFVPSAYAVVADTNIKIATVANFPGGSGTIAEVTSQIESSISQGAQEIDVVYPWRHHLAGNTDSGPRLIESCRTACGSHTLKVILETGELPSSDHIKDIALLALEAGADFLKTSTGKTRVSATPEAAQTLLQVIAHTNRSCGFKASGGISTIRDAAIYLDLADRILGPEWVTPRHFRFGASSLLTSLLETINTES